MTVVLMALVAAMIAERGSVALGLWLPPLLLALGVASVLQWYWSELRSVGDFRFYAAVQVLSMVVLLVAMLLPPRYSQGADLAVVASFYVLAKALESSDRVIFSVGHTITRHTPKHFAAAAAGYWILRMLHNLSCPVPATARPPQLPGRLQTSYIAWDTRLRPWN